MVFEILFLIFGFLYYIGRDSKYKQRIKEVNETGWWKEANADLEEGLITDYIFNYDRGDKRYIPKKYWNFFNFNEEARFDYCGLLAAQEVWKQGYRPYMFNFMPKDGYDFFEGFRDKYDKKVKEFNEYCDKL